MAPIILQHFNKIILSRPGTFKKSDLQTFPSFKGLKNRIPFHRLDLPDRNMPSSQKAYMLKEKTGRFWYVDHSLGGGIAEALRR